MERKRITRSNTDKKIAGICGGLGAYFDVDPVIFRILFCALLLCGFSGFLIYVLLIFVIPQQSELPQRTDSDLNTTENHSDSSIKKNDSEDILLKIVGITCIGIGICVLLFQFLSYFQLRFVFPALLLIAGIMLITFSKKSQKSKEYEK